MNDVYAKMVNDHLADVQVKNAVGLSAPKQPDLSQIYERLMLNTEAIRDLKYQVQSIVDRIYGSRPVDACAVEKTPEPNGAIEGLHSIINSQDSEIAGLRSQIRLLQEL